MRWSFVLCGTCPKKSKEEERETHPSDTPQLTLNGAHFCCATQHAESQLREQVRAGQMMVQQAPLTPSALQPSVLER